MVPRILVIAGSDCSGGAGLEADQKVIAAHGCYAMTATTALTAQNTRGVYDVHEVPPVFLRKQIDACLDDIGTDVVKTGMLASESTIAAVAEAITSHGVKTVVVDPVMVSTSGAKLLADSALQTMREKLLPLTTIVTPNIPEAEAIWDSIGSESKIDVQTMDDFRKYVQQLHQSTAAQWVLVKGGHLPFRKDGRVAETEEEKEVVLDVLYGPGPDSSDARAFYEFSKPYQHSRNTHGTGCSLASAIACNLAKGMGVPDAVKAASRYIENAIRTAPGLGSGNGPLNHFHSSFMMPFAPGRFMDYLLERPDVAPVWEQYTKHPFVMAMGQGTLPLESFKGYLVQDYLFLIQFARAYALAAYKATSTKDIASGATSVTSIISKEMNLHVEYCRKFGISRSELESSEELTACTAYTRYVLDIGHSQDLTGLLVALAPCLMGYGAIARYLHADSATKRGADQNPYWDWIEGYVSEEYAEAIRNGEELLERQLAAQSPSRIEELVKIFIHATRMEVAFWEMYPATSESS